jgi:hypothetical protein
MFSRNVESVLQFLTCSVKTAMADWLFKKKIKMIHQKKKIKTKRRERELPEKRVEGSWQSTDLALSTAALNSRHSATRQSALGRS